MDNMISSFELIQIFHIFLKTIKCVFRLFLFQNIIYHTGYTFISVIWIVTTSSHNIDIPVVPLINTPI